MTILSEHDRTALAAAQADLVAVAGKGDTQAERNARAARSALVMEIDKRYEGRWGLKTELARALGIDRTTVQRIYVERHTGRAAYRRGPQRARARAQADA